MVGTGWLVGEFYWLIVVEAVESAARKCSIEVDVPHLLGSHRGASKYRRCWDSKYLSLPVKES